MEKFKNVVIVGATSAIAHHCSRYLIKYGTSQFVLIGRNDQRINDVADDLRCRNGNIRVYTYVIEDFLNPESIQKLVDHVCKKVPPDLVLIAQGTSLPENSVLQKDLVEMKKSLEINVISPLLFSNAFTEYFAKTGHGTLAIFGSVAGDRGRQSNYIYGSAKGCIDTFAAGLRHRFFHSNIKICLVKPGPTYSPLTMNLPIKNNIASTDDTAICIVKGLLQKKKIIYSPRKWRYIMTIIRNIPDFLFGYMRI